MERGTLGSRSIAERDPGILLRLLGAADVRRHTDPNHSQLYWCGICVEMSDAQICFYKQLCMSLRVPQENPWPKGGFFEARVRIWKAPCAGCQLQVKVLSLQTCQPAAGASWSPGLPLLCRRVAEYGSRCHSLDARRICCLRSSCLPGVVGCCKHRHGSSHCPERDIPARRSSTPMTTPCDQTQLPSTDTRCNSALPHALHSVRAVTRTGPFHTFQDHLSNRTLWGALQYMYLLSLCIALPFFCFTTRLVAEAWLPCEGDTMSKFFLVWIYDGYITSHFARYLKLGSPLPWTTCLWVRREVGHFGLSLFCRWFFFWGLWILTLHTQKSETEAERDL